MSAEIKALMENKPDHWSQQGLCRGDDRFTGRYDSLTKADQSEMLRMCMACPALEECRVDAFLSEAIGVFQAGRWRGPKDDLPYV